MRPHMMQVDRNTEENGSTLLYATGWIDGVRLTDGKPRESSASNAASFGWMGGVRLVDGKSISEVYYAQQECGRLRDMWWP